MRGIIMCMVMLLLASLAFTQDRKVIEYTDGDLQSFLDEVPDSSIVIFPEIHMTNEQTLVIQHKKHVEFDFGGFTLHAKTTGESVTPIPRRVHKWPRSRSHLVIHQSSGVTIKNLNIVGPHENGGVSEEAYNKKYEAQHALEISGSNDIVIDSSRFVKIYGDGIYIAGNSKNIRIANNAIRKNGRQGIAIVNGNNIVIENNEFSEIRRAHIDMECNSENDRIEDIIIRNNTFNRKRLMWIAAASGKGIVTNVRVENNNLTCPASIYLGNRKGNSQRQGPYYFVGNRTTKPYGNPQGAIWKIRNVDGFYAEENFIIGQPNRNMYLIGAINSTDIQVDNNEVKNGMGMIKPK